MEAWVWTIIDSWPCCERSASLNVSFLYLQNDGWAWFLLQDTGAAEGLKVRIGVVEEVGVVVDQQRLDIVEDEAKFVRVLHGVQPWVVLHRQGGGEAAHAGHVQHFTNLESTNKEKEKTWEKSHTHPVIAWNHRPKEDSDKHGKYRHYYEGFSLSQEKIHTYFYVHAFEKAAVILNDI